MKIFDQLSSGQALSIDDEKYLVALGYGTYETNDNRFTVSPSGTQIVLDKQSILYHITHTPEQHIGFVNEDGSPFGSMDEYKTAHRNLNIYQESIDDGDAPVDLEYEYSIRRTIQSYESKKRVYSEPVEVKTPVEISIVGTWVETGSDFIVSSYTIGALGYNYGTSPYKVMSGLIAADEFEKLVSKYPKLTNATHSNIRYSQYKSSYVFCADDETKYTWLSKKESAYIFKTLEDAKAHENSIRKIIRANVNMKVEPILAKELGHETVTEIIEELQSALKTLNSVEATKKSGSSLSEARTNLRTTINRLTKLHEDR